MRKHEYPNTALGCFIYPFLYGAFNLTNCLTWAAQFIFGVTWIWIPLIILYCFDKSNFISIYLNKSDFSTNSFVYGLGLIVSGCFYLHTRNEKTDITIRSFFGLFTLFLVILAIAGSAILSISLVPMVDSAIRFNRETVMNISILFSMFAAVISFYLFLYSKTDLAPEVGSYESESSERVSTLKSAAENAHMVEGEGEFSNVSL